MKKKKTKLIDFETSCLLKDVGFREPCYFYYVNNGVTLMMSGEKLIRDLEYSIRRHGEDIEYEKKGLEEFKAVKEKLWKL